MNKLQKLHFAQLTHAELIHLSNNFLTTLAPLAKQCTFTQRNCRAIQQIRETIYRIETCAPPSEHSEEKRIIAAQIDKLLVTCRDTLRSNAQLETFMPAKAAASAVLYTTFQKRPSSLYHGGYVNQEEEIAKLLEELFDPIHDQNRAESGISLIFNTLRDTYDELLRITMEKVDKEKPASTITEQLALLRYRMEKLHSFIDGNCYDGIPAYVALEGPLNEYIAEAMKSCRSRKRQSEQELEDIPFN